MAIMSSAGGKVAITTPAVVNHLTDAAANTENSLTLTGTKAYKITNRGAVAVKYSFSVGGSGTTYASLYPHESYEIAGITAPSVVIYLQAPKPSQRLEIVIWS
jgi:hypothetical protein